MTWEEVQKILEKYDIKTAEDLEYSLGVISENDECIDDPEEKDCLNAKCYEGIFVPDSRKIVEIYAKYFKDEIKTKKLFVEYLVDMLEKGRSSIENYMSCKSCNQQMKKGNFHNLKIADSDFKRDFCNNLYKKFDYISLFCTEYESIGQFLRKEHEVTKDTFKPSVKSDEKMSQDEKTKLFTITHASKTEIKENLKNKDNTNGSFLYRLSLASSVFDRGLINESLSIVTLLENSKDFEKSETSLQLKAKILSSKQQDKEAIELLKKLIDFQKPLVNPETNNLLAASIKRLAFDQYKMYEDETKLLKELIIAKDMYFSTYQLTKDYYPALNYMYLAKMIAVVNNEDKNFNKEFSIIWEDMKHSVTDWWSFIAQVEYLILIDDFSGAKDKLTSHFDDLDEVEISEFNIASTIRQLELYNEFVNKNEIKEIIDYLNKATISK